MSEKEPLSLANLGGGAAVELFDREWKKLERNVQDPNTQADAVRTVTLTVKIKPSKDREFGPVEIFAASKLVAPIGFQTTVFMEVDRNGEIVSVEHNPAQTRLDFDSRPENVVDMPRNREAMND